MSSDVLAAWCSCDAVCFDVDSTLSPDEGIDILAQVAGRAAEVTALTASAMGGVMRFEDALARRLDLIRPSRQLIAQTLELHPPRLVDGAAALVAALQGRGTHVYLISGGFTHMVHPIADLLGVDRNNVFANVIRFEDEQEQEEEGDEDQKQQSSAATSDEAPTPRSWFDPRQFTSKSGGKARAIDHIRATAAQRGKAYNRVAMVGDGMTDAEAKPPADLFIGFGGVVQRPNVRERSDWFVTSFDDLTRALSCT
jgi:phosphoserine phosphatase